MKTTLAPKSGRTSRRPATTTAAPRVLSPQQRERQAQQYTGRTDLLLGFFLLGFLILAARSLDLALMQGPALKTRAEDQHKRKVAIPAHRGQIRDRNGKLLAVSLPVKTLSLEKDRIKDARALAGKLAPLLEMDAGELERRIVRAKAGSFPVLKRKLSPEVANKIEALKDPGLFFNEELQRFYPYGEMAGHLIGFVDLDNRGREGLERSFDEFLQGKPGLRIITRDRLGAAMPGGTVLMPALSGGDLVLTVDAAVQYVTYRALMRIAEKTQATAALAVVMDPENGEILAMANVPGFNPNNISASKPEARRNRVVSDNFEPGSTFKIFTVGAALDAGVVQPDTTLFCENGSFFFKGKNIRDHSGHGNISVREILHKSSNIGSAKIGLLMGRPAQEQYLRDFGFGQATGIAFDFEAKGSIPNIRHYEELGLANRSFGQGVTVTPLQLTSATAAVVNGGYLFRPRLLKAKMRDGRLIARFNDQPLRRVIKGETSEVLREILQGVVSPDGTAIQAKFDGYTVGGKTGTAQKAGPGGYQKGVYYSSFVGFTPVHRPRLVIYVGIDEPKGEYYGGLVAAPVFREILQGVLPHIGLYPNLETRPALPGTLEAQQQENTGDLGAVMADLTSLESPANKGADPREDASLLAALERMTGAPPLVRGAGRVVRQEQEGDRPRLVLE